MNVDSKLSVDSIKDFGGAHLEKVFAKRATKSDRVMGQAGFFRLVNGFSVEAGHKPTHVNFSTSYSSISANGYLASAIQCIDEGTLCINGGVSFFMIHITDELQDIRVVLSGLDA